VDQFANQTGLRLERACGLFDLSVLQTALCDEARNPDDEHHETRESHHEFE
jgi:hypothetical protein